MTAPTDIDDGARLKLAVIGTGRWGTTLMRAIDAHPDMTLAAVVSAKTQTPIGDANPDVPVYPTWQDAADTKSIEGFAIALPPDRQPSIAIELITAGFPVFLEKPIALTREAAQRLLAVSLERKFVGVVDHVHLFAGEFRELRRHLPDDKDITDLSIETVSGNRGPVRRDWTPCWDWAPHDVAMCLAVMGTPPQTATAKIIKDIVENGGRMQNYEIDLDFGNRGRAHIVTGNAFEGHRRDFRVHWSQTSLAYSETLDRVRTLVVGSGESVDVVEIEAPPPLDAALTAFSTRIRQKKGGLEDVQMGVAVVNVCAAIDESVESGASALVKSS